MSNHWCGLSQYLADIRHKPWAIALVKWLILGPEITFEIPIPWDRDLFELQDACFIFQIGPSKPKLRSPNNYIIMHCMPILIRTFVPTPLQLWTTTKMLVTASRSFSWRTTESHWQRRSSQPLTSLSRSPQLALRPQALETWNSRWVIRLWHVYRKTHLLC